MTSQDKTNSVSTSALMTAATGGAIAALGFVAVFAALLVSGSSVSPLAIVIGVLAIGAVAFGVWLTGGHGAEAEAVPAAGHASAVPAADTAMALESRVAEAVARAGRQGQVVFVLMLSADQYDACRAALGEAAAAALEAEIEAQLRRVIRREETALRLEANRFALVVEHGEQGEVADKVIGRIRGHFARLCDLAGERLGVTLSIGVAEDWTGLAQPGDLIRSAEVALAEARSRGGDGAVRYAHELDDIAHARASLARDFRRALSRNEDLALVFQPVFDISTNAMTGAEALLRWNHPIHGRLSAPFLMSLAADGGMLEALSDWIMGNAMAAGEKAGLKALSINFSTSQLENSEIISSMVRLKRQAGEMALSVEAGAEALDSAAAREGLRTLSQAGFELVLDGLGTGRNGKLAALIERVTGSGLKFSGLKVDTALALSPALEFQEQDALWATIESLEARGLTVTAKSVESAEQSQRLASRGVQLQQGRFWCAPVIGDTLPWIEADLALRAGEATPRH